MARAIERLPHLRLTILQRFEHDAAHLAAVHSVMRELREARYRGIRTRHQQAVSHAAAESDEAGRLDIAGIEHQARRKIDERKAPVEFTRDDGAYREAARSDLHRVADVQLQGVEQG